MNNYKRVFLIVLDSVGIGELPDASKYGDEGSNTIRAISKSPNFDVNMMRKMGIFNIFKSSSLKCILSSPFSPIEPFIFLGKPKTIAST